MVFYWNIQILDFQHRALRKMIDFCRDYNI